MATLTVRNLENEVRDRLRVRAVRNGRSMEGEVRFILKGAVLVGEPAVIWAEAHKRFSEDQGVMLDLPARW